MDPLLTDLYQLNMVQAYLDRDMTDTAVFEFFMRKLPEGRSFYVAAGLEQALDYIETLRFPPETIDWLAGTGRFRENFLDYLKDFRFTGDVHAMPEGTIFFPNEPILRVTAPLPEGQLLETGLINFLHFQSLIASKAARMVIASKGRTLVDFGLRRAHSGEAGLLAARASYLTGFTGTATVLANKAFGIPIYGTMAHSFIEAHDDETEAFEHFAQSRPDALTLLIDTYDTEQGARKVAALADQLKTSEISVQGVRLDSGDLAALAKSVRAILNNAGHQNISIFASGGLDEYEVHRLIASGAPIDGYGVGTSLTTSSDVAAIDCAYKLQEYAGKARAKNSPGKVTLPGRKQVWRTYDESGVMTGDTLSLETDSGEGEPLVRRVMRDGRRLKPSPSLDDIRTRFTHNLKSLPSRLRKLESRPRRYPVDVGDPLRDLADKTPGA